MWRVYEEKVMRLTLGDLFIYPLKELGTLRGEPTDEQKSAEPILTLVNKVKGGIYKSN